MKRLGHAKIAISLTKWGGIIAVLSIFGSNVQDLFCILQKTAVPGRDRDRKGGLTAQLATMQKG